MGTRYLSWKETPLAQKVEAGKATLKEIDEYAKGKKYAEPAMVGGKQESWRACSTSTSKLSAKIFKQPLETRQGDERRLSTQCSDLPRFSHRRFWLRGNLHGIRRWASTSGPASASGTMVH